MTPCNWFFVYLTFKWLDGLDDSIRRDIILVRSLVKIFILGVNSNRSDISVDAWNGIIYLMCKRKRSGCTLNVGWLLDIWSI